MEKASLRLFVLFSLAIIAFCSYLGGAREMAKEVNCLGNKCPEGMRNCYFLPSVAPMMDTYETNESCHRDNECVKYCPRGCRIVDCNFGTCFCGCRLD